MPDKKVLCYDCWKRGLERAERLSQTYKANIDKRFSDYRQAKQDYDQIGEQIRSLREKIRYEMEQAGKDHPYPNSVDDYADPSYIPYNFAKVKSMERDLDMLYKKRDALEPQTHLRSPQPAPFTDSSSIQYYQKGVYYDSVRAAAHEKAELDAIKREEERKKREEEEKARKEKERIGHINSGVINEDDRSFIEANPNIILPNISNEEVLKILALETSNDEMISYFMKSNNAKILCALSENPNFTIPNLAELYCHGSSEIKQHIERGNLFHDLQKYLFLQHEKLGGEIAVTDLPLIEEMYIGNSVLALVCKGYAERITATGNCMNTLAKNTRKELCWKNLIKEDYSIRLMLLDNPYLSEGYLKKLANDKSVTVLEALINNSRFPEEIRTTAKQKISDLRDERKRRSPYYTGSTNASPTSSNSGCCVWLLMISTFSIIAACTLL